jgi:hypothetical protein
LGNSPNLHLNDDLRAARSRDSQCSAGLGGTCALNHAGGHMAHDEGNNSALGAE